MESALEASHGLDIRYEISLLSEWREREAGHLIKALGWRGWESAEAKS
jgi:hypothetical protein